ncbi:MAG: isochorismatase family protein, partial [Bacteroidales bacterium]
TDEVLNNTVALIEKAKKNNVPVIIIQHVADPALGLSPFFNEGTEGVLIKKEISDAAPDAYIVKKTFADSFIQTDLEETLQKIGAENLYVCGMMTQNCVTHTAISKHAEKYNVKIVPDCCTTVSQMLHLIALAAVSTRMEFINSDQLEF